MCQARPAIQLLQASVDEDEESNLRLSFDGRSIKYIAIAAGVFAAQDMCFAPAIIPLLPELPSGNWNYGYIAKHSETHQPYFAQAIEKRFPGVQNAWHPVKIDYLDLTFGAKLRSGVYEAVPPGIDTTVIAKFARFDWEVDLVDRECEAYQWIEGGSIGPGFLGHITEHGRVIGFLAEKIAGASHATPSDITTCSEVLGRLHRLGMIHGDVNKHNFLINASGATLIDFDCTRKCADESLKEKEMQSLEDRLNDESGKGGSYSYTVVE